MKLLSHNQLAYEKVSNWLKSHQKACIAHATGTGKSYIIARLCQDFYNPIIVTPSNYINDQFKYMMPYVQCITYQKLLNRPALKNNFDLIIFDEFHRTGAEKWGESSNWLIENNPNAKVFGASATPIRDLDDNRDMSDEFFDGNQVSELSLGEAISQGILPKPTYVIGLYSLDSIVMDAMNKINSSVVYSDSVKLKKLTELESKRLDWGSSNGLDTILDNYEIEKRNKIIVFCESKSTADYFYGFFTSKYPQAYTNLVYSGITNNDIIYREFQYFNGLSILVTVDMLNEGIHLNGVDTVICLRSTQSNIIYKQQIGRCISTSVKDPLVLDLVGNIESSQKESNWVTWKSNNPDYIESRNRYSSETTLLSNFTVIDLRCDILDYINTIQITTSKNEVIKFCEEHERLPKRTSESELERRLSSYIHNNSQVDWVIELKEKYGKRNIFKEEVIKFCEEHKRLPKKRKGSEYRLGVYLDSHKNENWAIEIRNKYKRITTTKEEIIKFCEEHNRTPLSRKESRLTSYLFLHKNENWAIEIYNKYKRINTTEEEVIKFCEEHKRLPKRMKEDRLLSYLRFHKNENWAIEILSKYKRITPKEGVTKFCEEHKRLPKRNKKSKLEWRLATYLYRHEKEDWVIELKEKYNSKT